MSREPKPSMSPEEIHFDVLAMEVMKLGGDRNPVSQDDHLSA